MVKFFRKIRQKLFRENKISKYLLYAIGEIILVVIGILIAIQLNNWNESRKSASIELRYLQRLKSDLIQDTAHHNNSISNLQKSIDDNSKAIKEAYKRQNNTNEFHDLLGMYNYNMQSLTIQDDTYREMTSAGKFDIVENEKLKESIVRFYGDSYKAAAHIKEYNGMNQALLANLNTTNAILKYYPYPVIQSLFNSDTMFNDSDWEFINEPTSHKFRTLENCMLTYVLRQDALVPYYYDLKRESKLIIEMIDKEQNSRIR